KDLNLDRSQIQMFNSAASFGGGSFGINVLDSGAGFFGDTNHTGWQPGLQLTPTQATSDLFSTTLFPFPDAQMFLNTPTVYFENLNPTTNTDGTIVWRGVYLQDFSPPNVTKSVFFGGSDVDNQRGTFHIEWAGSYRDPVSNQTR